MVVDASPAAPSAGETDAAVPSTPLLRRRGSYARSMSHARDELRSFRSCLRWMCVADRSDGAASVAASRLVFALLAVAVPLAAWLALPRRQYDTQVQASLTLAAALSYATLSSFVRRLGLRRLLYLDHLTHDSQDVRAGYIVHLAGSFRLLACFVVPCFLADAAYKAAWYYGANRPLFFFRAWWWAAAACALEVASWIYRAAMFFMVCVLFRIICYLQILRMAGFAREFGQCADVAAVLRKHRRIRGQLRRISHRYRNFILSCLVLVTASQFSALLATTRPHAQVDIATAGELALCSMSLVTGLLICLHSAAKITHKTQAITSVAATWHAEATINSTDRDQENPRTPSKAYQLHPQAPASPFPPVATMSSDEDSDDDDTRSEDSVDTSRFTMSFHVTNISYQKRQALVTYLENNRAGITVFGFVVDRTWLHALFMIEFSLVMWLLGKTVGIS
ncbi:hypothetical protein PR202_ga20173 [Eleusine coracana subsp. coracana]|uniref:Uncharacterized protein n=1 Tax=Eleusine coracana subsp. coracana TaxID=191504 RepID=A0AAV5CY00_ELECO|nr:hypothetical protein QOZ80_4AG0315950 [Eleusine coracana subsp. coracana]GJN02787.1 hypothetical protein PR202_ga20173 [Eleusine coracana subsp. coracana]